MKRFLKLIAISLVSILCMTFAGSILNGCADDGSNTNGPIPNGVYVYNMAGEFVFQEGVDPSQTNEFRSGLVIEGNYAREYIDNWLVQKSKIVERDGKIYLECYKWRDLFDILFRKGKKQGTEEVYEVIYDADAKTITLELVE